jgi:hypothetical protein
MVALVVELDYQMQVKLIPAELEPQIKDLRVAILQGAVLLFLELLAVAVLVKQVLLTFQTMTAVRVGREFHHQSLALGHLGLAVAVVLLGLDDHRQPVVLVVADLVPWLVVQQLRLAR